LSASLSHNTFLLQASMVLDPLTMTRMPHWLALEALRKRDMRI
jgi:hypothetical protein